MIKDIRHTGIVIMDLEASLCFYRDLLGFQVAKQMEEAGDYIDNISSLRDVKVTTSFIAIGFRRVKNTLSSLKDYKNLALYLLAFFFYIEGVNTTIFFSGNFARTTLGFSFEELALFFLIVQSLLQHSEA